MSDLSKYVSYAKTCGEPGFMKNKDEDVIVMMDRMQAKVVSDLIGEYLAEIDCDDVLNAWVVTQQADEGYIVMVQCYDSNGAIDEDLQFVIMDFTTAAEDIAFLVSEFKNRLNK